MINKDNLVKVYSRIKTVYPSYVVLVQVGDFYEAIGGDAYRVAKVCGLTATTLGGVEGAVAICGLPVLHAKGYLDQLLDYGFSVAWVEAAADDKRVTITATAKITYPLV